MHPRLPPILVWGISLSCSPLLQVDVWSLGMILLEIFMVVQLIRYSWQLQWLNLCNGSVQLIIPGEPCLPRPVCEECCEHSIQENHPPLGELPTYVFPNNHFTLLRLNSLCSRSQATPTSSLLPVVWGKEGNSSLCYPPPPPSCTSWRWERPGPQADLLA